MPESEDGEGPYRPCRVPLVNSRWARTCSTGCAMPEATALSLIWPFLHHPRALEKVIRKERSPGRKAKAKAKGTNVKNCKSTKGKAITKEQHAASSAINQVTWPETVLLVEREEYHPARPDSVASPGQACTSRWPPFYLVAFLVSGIWDSGATTSMSGFEGLEAIRAAHLASGLEDSFEIGTSPDYDGACQSQDQDSSVSPCSLPLASTSNKSATFQPCCVMNHSESFSVALSAG